MGSDEKLSQWFSTGTKGIPKRNPNKYPEAYVNQQSRNRIAPRPEELETDLTITREIFLWGVDSQKAQTKHYMTVTGRAYAYTGGASVLFVRGGLYLLEAFLKNPQGQDTTRKYVINRVQLGGVAPHALSTIRDNIKAGLEAIATFGVSLLSWDISKGKMENQPVPTHTIGHVKVVTKIVGRSFEGGADSNYTTEASVNVVIIDNVYTQIYAEYLHARHLYTDYTKSAQRRNQGRAQAMRDLKAVIAGNPPPKLRHMDRWSAETTLQSMQYAAATDEIHPWVTYCETVNFDPDQPPNDPRKGPAPR